MGLSDLGFACFVLSHRLLAHLSVLYHMLNLFSPLFQLALRGLCSL